MFWQRPPADVQAAPTPKPAPVFSQRNLRLWPVVLLAFIGAVIVVFRPPAPVETPAQDALAVDTAGAVPRDEATRARDERRARFQAQQHELAGSPQAAVQAPLAPAPRPIGDSEDSLDRPRGVPPGGAQAVQDPLKADLERRRYEARFGSNLAASPGVGVGSGRGADSFHVLPATGDDTEPGDQPPSLQQIADAVVRANGGVPTPPPSASPPPPTAAAVPAPSPTPPPAAPATQPGPGRHLLQAGTVLETTLEHEVVTLGPIRCVLSTDIYAFDGTLVLPHGSKVLGEAESTQAGGEARVGVEFRTLQLTDGSELALASPGLDQGGSLGVKGKVDYHIWKSLGLAAAFGVIQGFGQYVATGFGSNEGTTVVLGDVTGQTSQVTSQIVSRELNKPPTVRVPAGHRVHVHLRSNLYLPAWRQP